MRLIEFLTEIRAGTPSKEAAQQISQAIQNSPHIALKTGTVVYHGTDADEGEDMFRRPEDYDGGWPFWTTANKATAAQYAEWQRSGDTGVPQVITFRVTHPVTLTLLDDHALKTLPELMGTINIQTLGGVVCELGFSGWVNQGEFDEVMMCNPGEFLEFMDHEYVDPVEQDDDWDDMDRAFESLTEGILDVLPPGAKQLGLALGMMSMLSGVQGHESNLEHPPKHPDVQRSQSFADRLNSIADVIATDNSDRYGQWVSNLYDTYTQNPEAFKRMFGVDYEKFMAQARQLSAPKMAQYMKDVAHSFHPGEITEAPGDFDAMAMTPDKLQQSLNYFYTEHAPGKGKAQGKVIGTLQGNNVVVFNWKTIVYYFLVDQSNTPNLYLALTRHKDGMAVGNVRSNGTVRATDFYDYILNNVTPKLYSDDHQTPEGRKLWANFEKHYDITVTDEGDRLVAVRGKRVNEARNPKVKVKYMSRNDAYYAYLGRKRVGQAQLNAYGGGRVAEDERYIWKSAVHSDYLRQGVATELYNVIADDLAKRGLKLVPSPDTQLSDEAYAFWKARDPESVKNHGRTLAEPYQKYVGQQVEYHDRPTVITKAHVSNSGKVFFKGRYADVEKGSVNSEPTMYLDAIKNQLTEDAAIRTYDPGVLEWLQEALSRPDADDLYLHGATQVQNVFSPEGKRHEHSLLHFSKLTDPRFQDVPHHAEYYGPKLFLCKLSYSKPFDVRYPNREAAQMHQELVPRGSQYKLDYGDIYHVIEPALEKGYDMFVVWEVSVRTESYAVPDANQVKVIDTYDSRGKV